jgi:hypothetical protein
MMPEVKMTKKQLKQFWNKLKYGVANDLTNELVRRCPVDTGFLKNSINYRIIHNGAEIGMAPYAVYVEFGTAPHIITPKKKGGTLHWKSDNKDVFAKKVNHPGTRPQPFIRPSLNNLPMIIKDNIRRHAIG